MTENDERQPLIVVNLGMAPHPVELAGWHSLNLVPMGEPGETAAVWTRAQAAVRIGFAECPTADDARRRLVRSTDQAMRPDLARGEDVGVVLGDESLVIVDDAGIAGAARFTRGNLFVSVDRADDEPTDAVEVAATIDRMLVDPPTGSTSTVRVTGGERLIVLDGLHELRGRRVHLAATGGRFVVEENAVVYEPADEQTTEVALTLAD
jgi:hypothetical protein